MISLFLEKGVSQKEAEKGSRKGVSQEKGSVNEF